MSPDLVVCGSLTTDNVVTADGRMLPQSCGGNVVYAALGARLWGPSVGLVSRAGADYPADFLDGLAARGLDLDGIACVDTPHGMNVAFCYRPDGSRVRAFPPEVIARIPFGERRRYTDYTTRGEAARYDVWLRFAPGAADVPPAWARAASGLHLAAMPVQRQQAIAHRLRARLDLHLQLDSPWYDERSPGADFHTGLLRDIDLLLPSEADLLLWRPGADPLHTAARLARQGHRPVLVKRGAAGCTLLDPDGLQAFSMPAFPAAVADPTGAGDAFCGGLLAGWRLHADLARAAVCGTVSASFAVEGAGISGLDAATTEAAKRRAAWLTDRIVAEEKSE